MGRAHSSYLATPGPGIGTAWAGRDFFVNVSFAGAVEVQKRESHTPSPHSNGPAIKAARQALQLSAETVVERASEAFDEAFLVAAEAGSRLPAHQLRILARTLNTSYEQIILIDSHECPFKGLLSFETEDAELFGGRERATDAILQLIENRTVVTLVGASGSGKSSIVKAGVVPRLQQSSPEWLGLILKPGDDPLFALARAIGGELDRLETADERIERARRRARSMSSQPSILKDLLDEVRRTRGRRGGRVFLFVDQWEEIYANCTDSEARRAFLENVVHAFSQSEHRLVITVRADFMDKLLDDNRKFFDLAQPGLMHLSKMTKDELRKAIEKPAGAVGLQIERDLVESIIKDAGDEPGGLAMVEFVLTQLWDRRDRANNTLTATSYSELGGLRGAIDRHADDVYGRLSPEDQTSARRALLQLVHVAALDSFTRLRRPLSDLDDGEKAALRKLADERTRLVVVSRDDDLSDDVVEVAHEALIREWKKLHGWIKEDPMFIKWRENLEQRHRRYQSEGRKAEDLLQGTDLKEALAWLERKKLSGSLGEAADLGTHLVKFVDESERCQARLAQAKIDAARRATLFLGGAAIVFGVFAVALGLLGWFFYREHLEAKRHEKLAKVQTIFAQVSESKALHAASKIDLERGQAKNAIELALAGMPTSIASPERPIFENLLDDLNAGLSMESPQFIIPSSSSVVASFNQKKAFLAKVTASSLELWNVRSGRRVSSKNLHLTSPSRVSFSADGNFLMIADYAKDVRVWSIPTMEELGVIESSDVVIGTRFLGEDHLGITAYSRGRVVIWNTENGEILGEELLHQTEQSKFALGDQKILSAHGSDDDRYFATAGVDGYINVWEPTRLRPFISVEVQRGWITSFSFSGDGTKIAAVGDSNVITTFDLLKGKESRHFILNDEWATGITASTRGSHVLVTGTEARVFDTISAQLTATLPNNVGSEAVVAFDQKGRLITSSESDFVTRVWAAEDHSLVRELSYDKSPVLSLWVQGEMLVVQHQESFEIWSLRSNEEMAAWTAPPEHDNLENAITWMSDDSLTIATVPQGSAIAYTWDIQAPENGVRKLEGHAEVITRVHFQDAGKLLLTVADDGAAILWNPTKGEKLAVFGSGDGRMIDDARFLGHDRVITSDRGSRFAIWRMSDGKKTCEINGKEAFSTFAVSRDGRLVAANAPDDDISIWDTSACKIVRKIGYGSRAINIKLLSDGRLVVANRDGQISLYLPDGALKASYANPPSTNLAMDLSADNKVLVISAEDGSGVGLWTEDLTVLSRAPRQIRNLWGSFVDPTGTRAISIGGDGDVLAWNLRTGEALKAYNVSPSKVAAVNASWENGELTLTKKSGETIKYNISVFSDRFKSANKTDSWQYIVDYANATIADTIVPATIEKSMTQESEHYERTLGPIQMCDLFAANPWDSQKTVTGVVSTAIDTSRALPVCKEALDSSPNDPRLAYQYGRVLQKLGRNLEAKVLFERAAERGYGIAYVALYYLRIERPALADNEALKLLNSARALNTHLADWIFAEAAWDGAKDLVVDRKTALSLFELASNNGIPQASEKLSELYELGLEKPQDIEMAFYYQALASLQYRRLGLNYNDVGIRKAYLARVINLDRVVKLWQDAREAFLNRDGMRQSAMR